MEMNEFLEVFREQFEDTDPIEIQLDTHFRNLEEWSSLMGMAILAMAKVNYDKSISGDELKHCITVKDVFDLISSK